MTTRAVAGRQRVQRARARRGDVEVRREPAIRIDLVRRKRQDRPLDLGVRQAFERGEEEPDVDRLPLDVGVGLARRARPAPRDAATAANSAFAGGVRPDDLPARRHPSQGGLRPT